MLNKIAAHFIFVYFYSFITFASAQEAVPLPPVRPGLDWNNLLASILYGLVGRVLLFIGYFIYELITPFSVKKELVEDQNIAIGIVVASLIIGMAIIIAAAII